MFARQVDPLAAFTSTLSAADAHHHQDNDSDSNHRHRHHSSPSIPSSYSSSPSPCADTSNSSNSSNRKDPSGSYNPYKRKHPLQFDPDFSAALDASLQELHCDTAQRSDSSGCWKPSLSDLNGGSPWPARPCKRAKSSLSKCPASQSIGSTSASSGSSTARLRAPSSASSFSPAKTKTIPDSSNRNSETIADSSSHCKGPTPPFPQASSPLPAWSYRNVFSKSPAFTRNSKGPSIIDLSSGEELVAIHLDGKEQQHKRRRNSSCEPSSSSSESAESLHQVFELQADGTLLPVQDPSPTDPSPAKRMRHSKTNRCPYLHFLSDDETEIERLSTKLKADLRRRKAHNGFIGSNRTHRTTSASRVAHSGDSATSATMAQSISVQGDSCTSAYGFWADQTMDATTVSSIPKDKNVLLDQACQSQTGDPRAEREQSIMDSNNAAHQAVVLYKGPKNVSLTPNRHMLDWNRWLDDETDHLTGLDRAQGHEMVLYQRESRGKDPSSKFGQHRSILWEEGIRDDDPTPSFKIEELGDDDDEDGGNLADDEVELSDDAPLMDLEEQATDMDLD